MRKKTLFIFVFISFVCIVRAQWVTQNSGTSAYLNHVFFPTKDTGYVTKEDGVLLKTYNGGDNWSQITPTGITYNIYFSSTDTGYAISDDTPQTNNGTSIKKTTDGGVTWITKFYDSTIYFSNVFFPEKNIGYALSYSDPFTGFMFKTIDAGENWFVVDTISSFMLTSSLFFTDSDTGYLSLSYGSIYKTENGGQNWELKFTDSTGNTELHSLYFPSANIGYAVGMSFVIGTMIYKTTDNGETWTEQITQEQNPLYSVYFTSNDTGFAVGGNGLGSGTVLKTTDGGNNWTLATSQTATFNSIFFPDKNTGYAVGTNGTIIKYTDTILTNTYSQNIFARNNFAFVYPNPTTTGNFTVMVSKKDFSANEKNDATNKPQIFIYNPLGELIEQESAPYDNQVNINLSRHSRGIYLIKIQSGEEILLQRMVYE